MMLHRHFDTDKSENMTTLKDVSLVNEGEDIGVDVLPPKEEKPKRGRKKKTEE